MKAHIEGRPVSLRTYDYYGCRCDDCRECKNAYMRKLRADGRTRTAVRKKVERRANQEALKWVRRNFPAQWSQFLIEAETFHGLNDLPDFRKVQREGGKS